MFVSYRGRAAVRLNSGVRCPMKDQGQFSKEEQAAMKARAAELKAQAKAGKKRADGEAQVLAAIKEMPDSDRKIAQMIHAVVARVAPQLWPKTWYGMPAYASDEKVVCFFQSAKKFGTRYATFGFSDEASVDSGDMWPTAYAVIAANPEVEKKIAALIKKAIK